jgi:hypothetical protein
MQSLSDNAVKKYTWLTFLSHFCLCQVHYLGIIFSFLSGIAYFSTSKNKALWKRILMPISLCWLLSIISYLFYLTSQKSVLNTWPKPIEFSDLLAGYNTSLLILTILIPVLAYILTNISNRDTETNSIKENHCSRKIMITSVLWLSTPFIFWIISQFTSLNLFVDRYFIPKEASVTFLVAYGISFIFQKLPMQKSKITLILGTSGFAIILFLISTKRAAFGLNKDTNYHHSLIIEEVYPKSDQPIILDGDPKYFPNAYTGKNEYLFSFKNESLIGVYQKFSSKIKFYKK